MDPTKLYTVEEFAAYLGVSKSTAGRIVRAQLVKSINVSPMGRGGRGTRILGRWITEYLETPQLKEAT